MTLPSATGKGQTAVPQLEPQMYGQSAKSLTEWLTAKEAAEHLKVETRTVLTWVRQGKLRAYSLSGTRRHVWRFLHTDLDAMLTGPSVAEPRRVQ